MNADESLVRQIVNIAEVAAAAQESMAHKPANYLVDCEDLALEILALIGKKNKRNLISFCAVFSVLNLLAQEAITENARPRVQ